MEGVPGLNSEWKKNAAIAVAFALEADRHVEIFVVLDGFQVAVFFRDGLAVDGAVVDDPLFLANLGPAGKILAVEELDPVFTGEFGPLGALGKNEGGAEREETCQVTDPHVG